MRVDILANVKVNLDAHEVCSVTLQARLTEICTLELLVCACSLPKGSGTCHRCLAVAGTESGCGRRYCVVPQL
jgi:hypothetical protein